MVPALRRAQTNGNWANWMKDSVDSPDPWADRQFEQAVRDTAYFLWEQDGRPMGREQDYWFQALERCLRQHQNDRHLTKGPDGAGK
jgi:hypothetical protein